MHHCDVTRRMAECRVTLGDSTRTQSVANLLDTYPPPHAHVACTPAHAYICNCCHKVASQSRQGRSIRRKVGSSSSNTSNRPLQSTGSYKGLGASKQQGGWDPWVPGGVFFFTWGGCWRRAGGWGAEATRAEATSTLEATTRVGGTAKPNSSVLTPSLLSLPQLPPPPVFPEHFSHSFLAQHSRTVFGPEP